MKSIFNSLGSNYDHQFVWLSLKQLFWPQKGQARVLKQKLDDLFSADSYLFYKGRDAIEFALLSFGIGKGDQVLTQAFSCFAIEEAITRTQAEAVFVDINQNLNLTVATLQKAFAKATRPKAVLVQNTLGSPAEIKKISQWCQQHHLILIEDLAQSLGAVDEHKQPLGTFGDAVILSFGRDKIIDSVSGGACLFKTVPPVEVKLKYQQVKSSQIIKDLFYPALTTLIRATDRLLLGKVIFQVSKKLGLLTSPVISPTTHVTTFPDQLAPLTLLMLNQLDRQIKHRRQIAQIYQQELKTSQGQSQLVTEFGANQRYFFKVKNPDLLTSWLEQKNIYISDRWYRQPVDAGKLKVNSSYQSGSCPSAELATQEIVNLPTHINVTAQSAQQISQYINQWFKTYV